MDFSVLYADAVADNQALRRARLAVRLHAMEALSTLRDASDNQPMNLDAAADYAIERLEIILSHLTDKKD